MANLFDRIGEITRNYVAPAAQFAGDVSTEYMLRKERARYNQLNGSGAPDDDAFLAKPTSNVDGATANGQNKFSTTNQMLMAGGILLVVGSILFWFFVAVDISMGKLSNIGGKPIFGGGSQIRIGQGSSSYEYTVADFVGQSVGRPVDPTIVPNIGKPAVPGKGSPIVSNNPIQASSPFLSALQPQFASAASEERNDNTDDSVKRWKLIVLALVALFLIYHYYGRE